jgi:hypothetical protein
MCTVKISAVYSHHLHESETLRPHLDGVGLVLREGKEGRGRGCGGGACAAPEQLGGHGRVVEVEPGAAPEGLPGSALRVEGVAHLAPSQESLREPIADQYC